VNDTRFDEIYDLSITDSNKFIEYFNNEAEIKNRNEQLAYLLSYTTSVVGLAISILDFSKTGKQEEAIDEFLNKLMQASKARSKETTLKHIN
jgi:hypothetical protein